MCVCVRAGKLGFGVSIGFHVDPLEQKRVYTLSTSVQSVCCVHRLGGGQPLCVMYKEP